MQKPDHLEALGRLSSRVAHDVSNYLYVVHSAAEVLTRVAELDARARAVVDMLQRNTSEAADLIEALLAFAGCQQLSPERVDLAEFGAGLSARLRDGVGDAVALECAFDADCAPVYADRSALEAALVELAVNARDAMPRGGRLAIRATNHGDEVAITVSDNGSGMTPEVRARAFEPFFTTKTGEAERGWGLSRVYGFVRQSNGRIDVETESGKGTSVRLVLPCVRRRPAAEPAARLEGLQVLLIEDEALIRLMAEDLLGQLGCRIVGSATNVAHALAMAERNDVDLALLDVNLRGEPCYPVAEALQARGVPFVFVSAYGEVEAPWRGRPMVQKPIELERLKREMQSALGAG